MRETKKERRGREREREKGTKRQSSAPEAAVGHRRADLQIL